MKIWCVCCNATVEARLRDGTDIYPHRPDLARKKFWLCQACNNYVGCHPGGTNPLGNIPTPELRKARGHIHALLDPIWKKGHMPRGKIYALISERIGYRYHTGEIKSVEDARMVYRIVQEIAGSVEKAA